jgi:hypothetical protein
MNDLQRLTDTLTTIVGEGGAIAPQRICAACVVALPVTGAAITVMTSGDRQEPIYATDSVANELDDLQFKLGEGPGVAAFRENKPVQIADLADISDSRWPMFAIAARRTPARAVYVLPLQAGKVGVGVLALYHLEPGLLPAEGLTGALRVADAALWALLGLRSGGTLGEGETETALDPHGWLTGAPLHRTEVYQATGMIIAQLDVSAATALARLRGYAFTKGPSLGEVAREVVTRRLRFDKEKT